MNMLDLFSGIGGFHKGFEQAGYKLDWVGFSEVDKYSSAVYKHRFKNVKDLGDVRTIQSKDLPKIDLITFGSPCQDFSQASGSRSGLKGHRSSLIRESIRLISECKPHTFIWENVKGTFSSNNGEDFWAIIQAFINIGGYRLEWELLNSRWFQVPQNRERIYLIGHLGGGSGRTVFPLRETSKSASEISLKQIGTIEEDSEATRVYDANGLSKTIKDSGVMGVKTGLYEIKEATHKGYKEAYIGDSVDITQLNSKTRRGRVGKGVSHTLDTGQNQCVVTNPKIKEATYNYGSKALNKTLEKENLGKDDIKALDLYNHKAQDICPTLTEPHHNSLRLYEKSRIRRLTPIECERLQGFPDNFTSKGIINNEVTSISNSQRYKQLGNAVTVNVVQAIAEKLNKIRR